MSKLPTRKCLRCGYVWYPRKTDKKGNLVEPKNCPARNGCGSPYWDKPRRKKRRF